MTDSDCTPDEEFESYYTYKFEDDEQPSSAIVATVAVVTNQSPLEMGSLYEVVDPQALDALFSSTYEGQRRTAGQFIFQFAGCEVVVESGRVHVQERDGDAGTMAEG